MHINRICLPENYTSLFFMNLHQRFPETFIVAEENGKIAGYVMCRIETGISSFRLLGIAKKGHVISIAVLPEHHREGIGSTLMQEAMKAMVTYKAKECYLEVRTSNLSAVNLYRKIGFEVMRIAKGYYSDGEAANVMAKRLTFTK